MGAPPLNWIFRATLSVAAVTVAIVVVRLPIPLPARAAVLGAAAAAALALAFRYMPAFDPLGRVRWRLGRSADGVPECALTFDDGPGPDTGRLLDILQAEGVRGTFFVLGSHVVRHPDVVRRMAAGGHTIGLHGMQHRKLNGLGTGDVEREVDAAAAALQALGVAHAPIYRTPHGIKSAAVFEVARRRGLTLWAWSRGVWDTARPSPDVLVRRATRWTRPGLVLLLHDGRGGETHPDVSAMLAALPEIIRILKNRGFRFVTLSPGA
jgi:peptidoglycan/xylan/chitin deacetylase (PgdA/CDA1 family)